MNEVDGAGAATGAGAETGATTGATISSCACFVFTISTTGIVTTGSEPGSIGLFSFEQVRLRFCLT